MAKKINYTSRNFSDIRGELIEFVRQYYPDIFNDFNDASVGMMLIELNAAVGDMLSFNTDRTTPRLPLSLPAITTTSSPFFMRLIIRVPPVPEKQFS